MKNYCNSFNPAEAEEWFRREIGDAENYISEGVSIQPKPKNGLEEIHQEDLSELISFNPAEAEEWFRRF